MEKAKVYFDSARGDPTLNLPQKVARLFSAAGFGELIEKGDRVALKVHWGEPGNTAFISPIYVRTIAAAVHQAGGLPFITDTNTLYNHRRANAIDHLHAARANGYTFETTGAPLIIADGLAGKHQVSVPVAEALVGEARVAGAIVEADAMIVLSHFKGHLLFGYGGALKNLSMGCATPTGKHILHCDVKPRVIKKKCQVCGKCLRNCPSGAISLLKEESARIDPTFCIGCGECVVVCPEEAIPINWKTAFEPLFRKSAAYARAAVTGKELKCGFMNFIINVTPDCDCCSWNDLPIVPDIGFAASTDPVAIDRASVDLVNLAPVMPGSVLDGKPSGGDKFQALRNIDHDRHLAYAEAHGLGTREYELIDRSKPVKPLMGA